MRLREDLSHPRRPTPARALEIALGLGVLAAAGAARGEVPSPYDDDGAPPPTAHASTETPPATLPGASGAPAWVPSPPSRSRSGRAASEGTSVEVVVTGKRIREESFFADRAVSAVSSHDLAEARPRTTPEALWDTPGVFVQQTNHGGGSPIVRGLVGPQVLLLLDGVRLNNAVYRTGPVQYLNLVAPSSLARIEVLRGPGSVLYGADAMGGVIQLFPLEPRGASELEVHGGAGARYASAGQSFGTSAQAELGVDGFGLLGAGTLGSLGDLRAGRSLGPQPHSGYASRSALGTLRYRFADGPLEGASTKAGYLYSRLDDVGRTDKLYDAHSLQIYDNELHLAYDRWHFEIEPMSTSVEITPSFQHFFERKNTLEVGDDFATARGAKRDEVAANTFGLDLAVETTIAPDRLAARYGGLYYQDWVEARSLALTDERLWQTRADQVYPAESTYRHFGGFLMLDATPWASPTGQALRLRAGYRLHGMAGDAPAQSDVPAVAFSHLGHVFMAAVQYLAGETGTVALSFEQGFRAPNLTEAVQLGDSGRYFHIPNDELGPERSNTVELLGRVHHGPFEWTWAGFISLLDNLIKRVPTTYQGRDEIDGKTVVRNVNADRGLLWGMEGGLGLDLGDGFSLRGQASYAHGTEFREAGDALPMTRIPPLFGHATLRYDTLLPASWRAFVESTLRWAIAQNRLSLEDRTDTRIPDDGTPGWQTVNLRAGLSAEQHCRIVLSIENLLDTEYKYHGSGVYGAGTNAIVSYEAGF